MRYQRHLSLIVSFDHDFFPYELKASSANLMSCSCDVLNLLLGRERGVCWALVWCGGLQSPALQIAGFGAERTRDRSLCLVVVRSCFSRSRVPDRALITVSFCILCFFLLCGPAAIGPRFSVSLENYCSQISD